MCFLLLFKKIKKKKKKEIILVKNKKVQILDALQISFRQQKIHCRVVASCLSCGLSGPGKSCSCQWLPKPFGEPSSCMALALSTVTTECRLGYTYALIRLQIVEDSDAIPASQTRLYSSSEKL